MNAGTRLNRRAFLVAVGVAAVAGLGGARWLRGSNDRSPELALTGRVGEILPDQARRLGETYMRDHPEEAGELRLVRLLEGSDARWRELRRAPDGERARRLARANARSDYRAGRIVAVDGWYLSRTEARLCALATYA